MPGITVPSLQKSKLGGINWGQVPQEGFGVISDFVIGVGVGEVESSGQDWVQFGPGFAVEPSLQIFAIAGQGFSCRSILFFISK